LWQVVKQRAQTSSPKELSTELALDDVLGLAPYGATASARSETNSQLCTQCMYVDSQGCFAAQRTRCTQEQQALRVDGAYLSINTAKLALNQETFLRASGPPGSVALLAFCSQALNRQPAYQNLRSIRGHIAYAQVPHSLYLVSQTAYAFQFSILGLLLRQLVQFVWSRMTMLQLSIA